MMADNPGSSPSTRRWTILAFSGVAFFALLIAALGLVSVFLEADVIAEPGFGPFPGAVGVALALGGWVAVVAPALHRRAGVGAAVLAGVAAGILYPSGVLVAGTIVTADPALAAGAAWRLVWMGFAPAVAVAGLLAATGAVVAVRTTPGAARWPWEKNDDES